MSVSVQREDFDIAAEMARLTGADQEIGAVVSFTADPLRRWKEGQPKRRIASAARLRATTSGAGSRCPPSSGI